MLTAAVTFVVIFASDILCVCVNLHPHQSHTLGAKRYLMMTYCTVLLVGISGTPTIEDLPNFSRTSCAWTPRIRRSCSDWGSNFKPAQHCPTLPCSHGGNLLCGLLPSKVPQQSLPWWQGKWFAHAPAILCCYCTYCIMPFIFMWLSCSCHLTKICAALVLL